MTKQAEGYGPDGSVARMPAEATAGAMGVRGTRTRRPVL